MNRNLKDGLDPACISLELTAKTRDDAIHELIGLIHAKHRLKNLEEATRVVMEREQKMSTSLENGLAVPHGKAASVDRLLVAVGLKKKGIDFKSSDGQKSKIIILILSSAATSGPHMKCLAEISRLLQSPDNCKKILKAKSVETVYELLIGSES
ncbi:MAG: PTS sugar transporter subunit IIA [Pontiellaceae bacterium]|nr:PTS sugar transporter subunit IIA [Pontiellaceae bacterium]MBN2783202.1 PTS sugar transporter subunit IIA [Pontiellaceae bacterium]